MANNIVFISGANRGLGLEFVRQLSTRGDTVIGGYRKADASGELLKLADERDNVHAVRVEATDRYDIENVKNFIHKQFGRLDILINNAGIHLKYSIPIDELEPDEIIENFRVNVIGPFLTGKILKSLLAKSDNPRLINITSEMGSIARSSGGATPYRVSKAALNMLSKNQSLEYKNSNITTIALHPGWVKTDMGGVNAPLEPPEAIGKMLQVIDSLTPEQNGTFLSYSGETLEY